jgi:hypothetical protein
MINLYTISLAVVDDNEPFVRSEAQGARLAQSHSSACEPQSCVIESTGEREPPEEQGSAPHARCRRADRGQLPILDVAVAQS